MRTIMKRHLGFLVVITSMTTVFAGCKNKDNNDGTNVEPAPTPSHQTTSEIISKALLASTPDIEINVGEFEHLEESEVHEINSLSATYCSSSILNMSKDDSINIVYNSGNESNTEYSKMLFNNVINANNEMRYITISDREGHYLERQGNLLKVKNDKIEISKEDGFEYGKIYNISIENADFLAFENKDPLIRTLTIEIEDDSTEESTYNNIERKNDITILDINKVLNKKVNVEQATYTFEYEENFPNLKEGDLFLATAPDKESKIDFYGIYQSRRLGGSGRIVVTYTAPSMEDIYNSFRIKGISNIDLSNANILLNKDVVLQQFRTSDFARGVAKAALPLLNDDVSALTTLLSGFKLKFNISIGGNQFSFKFETYTNNLKLSENRFLTVDFAYEKNVDYRMDYDISLCNKYTSPIGLNYKIKCIEDTKEISYLKSALSDKVNDNPLTDNDFSNQIIDEINKIKIDKENSILSDFINVKSSLTSNIDNHSSLPIFECDLEINKVASFKIKNNFFVDSICESLVLFKHEIHTKKSSFVYSTNNGVKSDLETYLGKSSDLTLYGIGKIDFELYSNTLLDFSILGLHDYLTSEASSDSSINVSIEGLLQAEIPIKEPIENFDGKINGLLDIKYGVKNSLDYKVLNNSKFINSNASLFNKLNIDNTINLEDWSENAVSEVLMNKQTMSLDETDVLGFKTFSCENFDYLEKKYNAGSSFNIMNGYLLSNEALDSSKGMIFTYSIDNENVTIDENGVIHVSDLIDNDFDFNINIKVNNLCGSVESRSILVHYLRPETKEAYLTWNGNKLLIGSYLPGTKFVLPEYPVEEGVGFLSYWSNHKYYLPGDEMEMTNETLLVEANCYNLPEYLVRFYDGNSNLIYEDLVYEGSSSSVPSQAIRDRFMDTLKYQFVCWNQDFNNIKSNLDIYGIYTGIMEA